MVAISSRALFNFEEENRLFESGDDRAYMQLQLERLDRPAKPGHRLLADPEAAAPSTTTTTQRVEVVILSRNDPVSGMRIFRSAQADGMPIAARRVHPGPSRPLRYLRPLARHLFLSANADDVREALAAGFPAARVLSAVGARLAEPHPNEVRIAFDGDAVLFSDEAERVFQAQGLDAFQEHEREQGRRRRCPPGPFKPLLRGAAPAAAGRRTGMRIRTALVTARSAPAHERAIRTLMDWNIQVDEAMFLGGLPKGEFLREFEPDFFFDDQTGHVEHAAAHVPSGHVAAGVSNPRDG